MSAYVELVFDNSDGRLPVDRDEVRLRRAIGLKKDEFYLDKKHMSKSEVMNMLESAGFSRANPYYIVQQGKIMEMAHMSDGKRLELLKEIGGTKVYEERRRDSLDVMRECEGKRRSIQDLVDQLDSRLAGLDAERAELAAYQAADRERRSLEYTILDREISTVKEKLGKVEEDRQKAAEKAGDAADERRDNAQKLKSMEKELKKAASERAELERRRKELAEERDVVLRRRAQLELEVQELEQRLAAGSGAQDSASRELVAVEREIKAKERELQTARLRLKAAEEQEASLAASLAADSVALQAMYAKQGGEGQYKSAKERDAALQQEIVRLEEAITTKRESRHLAETQATEISAQVAAAEQAVAAAEIALEECQKGGEIAQTEALTLHSRRDELQNKQKGLWRREDEIKRKVEGLRDELRQHDKIMEIAAPRDVTRGLNSVKRLVAQHRIQGVHGTLMELFDCPHQLNTAVETVAGNSLFHIVVDDDLVATKLTELLIKEKSGRATFMPLNRLRPSQANFPTKWGTDVVPLIGKLKYAPKFAPAVQQVFGKVVVCRSLEVATEVAAQDGNVSCVTMEGDQVERRGALRGGFFDARKSRIAAMKEYKTLTGNIAEVEKELVEVEKALNEVGQEVTAATSELTKLAAKQQHLQMGAGPARAELRNQIARRDTLARSVEAKLKQVSELEMGLVALDAEIAARQARLGTPLRSELTAAERRELARLQPAVEQTQEEISAARAERMDAQAAVDALDALLTTNLLQRAEDLRETAAAGQSRTDQAELVSRRAALEAAAREGEEAAAEESEAEKRLKAVASHAQKLESEKEKLVEEAAADKRTGEDFARNVENLQQRRTQLQMKRSDLERRVRDLGTLPADAYEAHRSRSLKDLHSRLQNANTELKKFAHVNKKALDQYVSFSDQRDELVRRKAENDGAEAKIRQLISTLDLRKDEAIERTFKGVALHFREIFGALVPGGRGELVMQKAPTPAPVPAGEENEDPDGEQGSKEDTATLEKYSGVKVRVSFGTGEVLSMKQLSGGQKTLVALTLIFAIQRCDPAPFYLFDEIDAALDPQYRSTVALMLKRQANDDRNPAQFIVTTFHPQIVAVADNIYGVSHRNRISNVVMVECADALEFLQAEERKAAAANAKVTAAAAGGSGGAGAGAGAGPGAKRARAALPETVHEGDEREEEEEEEERMEVD